MSLGSRSWLTVPSHCAIPYSVRDAFCLLINRINLLAAAEADGSNTNGRGWSG